MPRLRTLLPALIVITATGVCGAVVPAAGAAAKKPKVKCKAGTVPKITGSGKKAKLVVKKGKVVCVKPPKAKPSQVEAAPATPQGSLASTADQLTQALTMNPEALARAEKKLGKKASKALVDRALNGWRAGARASTARRTADDGGFHYDGTFGDTSKGTSGSARLDAGPAGEGGQGIKANAVIEFSADGKGLKSLGADKVTNAKNAKVKLELSFEDAPNACPTAAGKVKGAVNASATLTLTTDGTTVTIAAKVSGTYELTVGTDAHWKTIDNVDVRAEFSFGGSGQKTETWRGQRGGSGFGQRGVFGDGAGKFDDAIAEQASHINANHGGVWGPRGRVLFSDPSTDNIFNYGGSFAHLKGMVMTDVATTLLTYAAVEYVRHVVGPRGDKHWHDAEACLKLAGAPDKASLGPGETATVTVSDAKAADGTPVAAGLSGSGQASLTPGAASLAAGGKVDFTLTAPSSSPVVATYTVTALSPAGKKTVSGTLGEQAVYTLLLDDQETGDYATHNAAGRLTGSLRTTAVPGAQPAQSLGTGLLTWSNLTATVDPEIEHSWLEQPVPGTPDWTGTVTSNGDSTVNVKIDIGAGANVLWTWVTDEPYNSGCQCDPPRIDIPGTAGTHAVALWARPLDFDVPADGGTFTFDREFTESGDGMRSVGTLTVIPGSAS